MLSLLRTVATCGQKKKGTWRMTVNASIDGASAVRPFLKWAGGKRWLAPYLTDLLNEVEGRYIEPFVGGGAIFFALAPRLAILSDINERLIDTYRCVREKPLHVETLLTRHDALHCADHYYRVRDAQPPTKIEQAAQFIYLNRTCWNGLYRVNRRGQFNVPIGTKVRALLPSDDWGGVSALLSRAEIICQDFEKTIDLADEGDVVFADPPYTVKHNLNGFIKYNEALFSWEDQIRLRDCLLRAKARNVKIVLTNADHASVRKLYAGSFLLRSLERSSVLAGDSQYRGRYSELLITAN